jgi:hypothetical protein
VTVSPSCGSSGAIGSGFAAGRPYISSLAVSPSSADRKLSTRTMTGAVITAPCISRGWKAQTVRFGSGRAGWFMVGAPVVGSMAGPLRLSSACRPSFGSTQWPAVTIVVGLSNQPVQIVMTGSSSSPGAGVGAGARANGSCGSSQITTRPTIDCCTDCSRAGSMRPFSAGGGGAGSSALAAPVSSTDAAMAASATSAAVDTFRTDLTLQFPP